MKAISKGSNVVKAVLVVFLALALFHAPLAFSQTLPSSVQTASKTRLSPFTYKVDFTIKAGTTPVCDLEMQVDSMGDKLSKATPPANWRARKEENAVEFRAKGVPATTNCIAANQTLGGFQLVIKGTPPFSFDVCFTDKDGKLIDNCIEVTVASNPPLIDRLAVSVTSDQELLNFSVAGEGAKDVESSRVEIYDLRGRKLFDSGFMAGTELRWHGLGDRGRVANGVYFYRVTVRDRNGWLVEGKLGKLIVLR